MWFSEKERLRGKKNNRTRDGKRQSLYMRVGISRADMTVGMYIVALMGCHIADKCSVMTELCSKRT